MSLHMQNPGEWVAGASRNQLGGWLHPLTTQTDWRAQLLAARFGLSPVMAREVATHFFGEGRDD
jgi:hypothetical protein